MKISSLFVFIFLSLATLPAHADLKSDIAILRKKYATEVELAGKRGAYSSSAFRLAFSTEGQPLPEIVGNILRAIDLQEAELGRLETEPAPEKVVRPGNDFKTDVGLKMVAASIALDCRHCRNQSERLAYARAAKRLVEVYDIQAAGLRSPRSRVKFSGLPFFDLVTQKFVDTAFQIRTTRFYEQLELVLASMTNPAFSLPPASTNVYDIALNVCGGNSQDAIELAGILLSRDSNVIKYFSYMPKTDPFFMRRAALIPLMVQLITRLDEIKTGRSDDRFSFDGRYSVTDPRGYYFWSAALVSDDLRRSGVSEDAIKELNLQFARHYKILRWYEDQARRVVDFATRKTKNLAPLDQESHEFQARRTMRITGGGVRLSKKMVEQNCRNLTEKL